MTRALLLVPLLVACADESPWNPDIDAADLGPEIDHPFLPFPVGASWTYEAQTEDGLETVEVVVLPDTREVMGVQTRVVRDTVTVDGELVEDTFDWFAQHDDGTVWYFGEDTTEYEGGVPVSNAGAWEAGVDGALPGIVMPGDPQVGDAYYQEFYEGVAEDEAEIVAVDASAQVPYGSFDGCVQTHDFTALEPDVAETKTYCDGVGLVLAEQDDVREQLISFDPGD